RLLHVHQNIRSVKRHYCPLWPMANQRPQQHSDMAEIDMQQLRVAFSERALNFTNFAPRNLPWLINDLFEPDASQKMPRRLFEHSKILNPKTLFGFQFLRNRHRPASPERLDLPVDVQHLRFQKSRAVRRDYGNGRRAV